MVSERKNTRPKRTTVTHEEERVWVGFYRRVGNDPAIATELLAQLDADPDMKRTHLALYLCCKESIRMHLVRQARNERIGAFVRWVCGSLFIGLPRAARKTFGRGGDVAVACLPDTAAEPATQQVQRLTKRKKYAQDQAAFERQARLPAAGSADPRPNTAANPDQPLESKVA